MPRRPTKSGLNAGISRYFLERSRITFLALVGLVLIGTLSLLSLRTTGFPSPELNVLILNTVYPGASAQTIEQQITTPLEAEVKELEGVKSYSSSSQNNVSTISVIVDEGADADTISSKLDAAAKAAELPEGAEAPKIIKPKVSSDEYYYALVARDGKFKEADAYRVMKLLERDLEKDADVAGVNFPNDYTKRIQVSINVPAATAAGLSAGEIVNQLRGFGLEVPAAEKVPVGGKEQNVVLSSGTRSLEDLRSLPLLSPARPGATVALSTVASIQDVYSREDAGQAQVGYRADDGTALIGTAIAFSIDVADSANLSSYDKKLGVILEKYFDQDSAEYQQLAAETKALVAPYRVVDVFNAAFDNKEQVSEIKAGLFGRNIEALGPFGFVGYLFGGIQLVFVLMLLLVSWRAAFIAALAIPLSFFFSAIVVLATGNELNTLVLFSLVLVIGLVVDPALVVLEVIQRKIDAGLRGKDAVLTAISEIGGGLFMAVLCSTLVFIPFGVVSGIFGQIISYIPLTVIPAIVASYIVPLVFLASMARVSLKRKKKAQSVETENLWPAAKWMMRANRRILSGRRWIRALIVIAALVVPLALAQGLISSGALKIVQFATTAESNFLLLTAQQLPQKAVAARTADAGALYSAVLKNPDVTYVAPVADFAQVPGDITFIVGLKPPADRQGGDAAAINESITADLAKTDIQKRFFSLESTVSGPGPGNVSFPISIGIKTEDTKVQREVAGELTTIANRVCLVNKKYEVRDECKDGASDAVAKVDNGFDAKPVSFVQISLDKLKLGTTPVQPLAVREAISNVYVLNDNRKVALVQDQSEDLEVIVQTNGVKPDTVAAIAALPVPTLTGQSVPLSAVATVTETSSVGSINRVDGETIGVVRAKPTGDATDQQANAAIQKVVVDTWQADFSSKHPGVVVESYSEGDVASIAKSFSELGIALGLAILIIYLSLAIFFNSLMQPLVILFAIPLTFLGVFPALTLLGGGQFGFLEIIGLIILIGLVVNVAIFLMDLANRKVREGMDAKEAIIYASGIRFRPIILTKLTALFSLAPLAILAPFYRSLAIVIMFGLLTSGILSLFVSPILYLMFNRLSGRVRSRVRSKKRR